MKLLEYQGKELFREFDIPVPEGSIATSVRQTEKIARNLGGKVAVKAQVSVGGRGVAGGIKLVDSPEEAAKAARSILGSEIKGEKVNQLLITRAVDIAKELYVGITLDRSQKKPVVILSTEGGVDIEEVARQKPQAIHRFYIHPLEGIQPFQIRKILFRAGFKDQLFKSSYRIIEKLYKAFLKYKATLVEINPLAITGDGKLVAIDSKFIIDDDSLSQFPKLNKFAKTVGGSLEEKAKEAGLQYVKLDGNIGVIGNGAGLVMATLDVIQAEGGKPANFLDIGGGASSDRVKKALEIVSLDERIEGILVNIFGGITRCDQVAKGIIAAKESLGLDHPMVVRLTGTNESEGRKILEEKDITPVSSLEKGVRQIVKFIN